MLLNLTTEIRIHADGAALDSAIRTALRVVADGMLRVLGLSDVNPERITSKTNIRGSFAKFTYGALLSSHEPLDREYLDEMFHAYRDYPGDKIPSAVFEHLFRCQRHQALKYTKVHARESRPGIGFTLLQLHVMKIITLPPTFNWPSARDNEAYEALSLELCEPNELLRFIRSLIPPHRRNGTPADPTFGRVADDKERAEYLCSKGTKVLLALGWHRLEDMALNECNDFVTACRKNGVKPVTTVMYELFNALKLKFGSRASFDGHHWMHKHNRALRSAVAEHGRAKSFLVEANTIIEQQLESLDTLYLKLLNAEPAVGNFDFVAEMHVKGELPLAAKYNFSKWFQLHTTYFRRTRYEAKQKVKNRLGILGLYLFYYLPSWFEAHPDSGIEYPDEPNKLLPGLFISRWMESDRSLPVTLTEFVGSRAKARDHDSTTQYGTLSALNIFFDFIEENSHILPGCNKFQNQLTKYDFPRTGRSYGTNKRAIPRQLFAPYIRYLWSIKSYIDHINERILEGLLGPEDCDALSGSFSFIDTFGISATALEYVPVVFFNDQCIPIRYLPFKPMFAWYKLKDGRHLRLVCPHGINQIICALLTGLRHNHIQWLDVRTFDKLVQDDDLEFTKLYVNTDKVKKSGWAPEVNMSVIEVLRSQKQWRELIGDEQFSKLHNYNGNDESEYEPILPLFAYTPAGAPHNDSLYQREWSDLLAAFQGFAPEMLGHSPHTKKQLIKLLPPKTRYGDPNLRASLRQWGSIDGLQLEDNPKVDLLPRSDITPHSSRVSVVTHTMTFLPPEFIGLHITGQSLGTVLHYYRPDPEDARLAIVHQGMRMRELALQEQAVATVIDPDKNSAHHIQVDVNSALARSIKINLEGTIADYGCISLIMRDGDTAGIDVLRERGVSAIAFNKTELCPYDNNCPESIVKMLRGIRRCSLCPCAVRSIDHLPAIAAKKKQVLEMVLVLDKKLDDPKATSKYTDTELDLLENDRQRLGEDIAGWEACEQMLEVQRTRIASGADTRRWMVERPSIIQEDLRKIETQTAGTTYLLSRLAESVSYPGFQSEYIKSMIDIARRRILARAGDSAAAFSNDIPVDPAAECAGLIRTIVEANGLTTPEVVSLLDTDQHLQSVTRPTILGVGYDAT